MARSSEVVKKIRSFKRQLSDTTQPATILKTLRKLEQLDVTLDILAETGIGKTVNSLRRHEQAGDFAKSLVRSWKKMMPKESASDGEKDGLGSVPFKDKKDYRNCPTNRLSTTDESKSTCLVSPGKNQDTSDELFVKKGNRKAVSEKPQCKEQKRDEDQNGNYQNPKHSNMESEIVNTKTQLQEDKQDASLLSQKKEKDHRKGKSKDTDGEHRSKKCKDKSRHSFQEKWKSSSDTGSGRELHKKKSPKEVKEHVSINSDKWSKMQNMVDEKEDRSSGLCHSPEVQNCNKRKKPGKGRDSGLEYSYDSEDEGNSTNEHKKAKMKQKDEQSESEPEEPSMSFESYLNYDFTTTKRKKPSRAKYPLKNIKTVVKREKTKDLCMKPVKLPVLAASVGSPKKKTTEFPDFIKTSTSAVLPDSDKLSSIGYSQRKVENFSDVCNISEEPTVFTGQRLNSKMQVYSGAKTTFLATMMTLYQQCIRTLQNNVNLLYETGGVPFEILEPVLERCTPEQLLRIEECNPIYIGVTDHLWGKHCERDFRDAKLEEYESWKEMYIRLSDERERKLRRLTKSIVSAHSNKPKGRQVKMAFIHTAAKPPRDVRIQQEIHGTAVQPPPQLKCSGKVQDNRSKHGHSEPTRSNISSSGMNNAQDARKKTRVAPMMAKSLKALKQLGRR